MTQDKRTVLYRFFDDQNVLLYVGITDRPGRRWSEHMHEKPWWPGVRRQTAEWYENRETAQKAERAAIRRERPAHNIAHTADTPYKVMSRNVPGPLSPAERRLLLYDLDAVLGTERVRLAELPARLRFLAPDIPMYQKLTGLQLGAALKDAGIRTTNTGNILRLDPADLRVALKQAG